MREQFINLRAQMLAHLDKVENQFLQDRQKLIGDYKQNVENLIRNLDMVESSMEKALTSIEDECELAAERAAYKQEMEFINKIIIMEKHSNFLKETIEDFTYEVKILLERLEYRVEVRDEKIKENEEKKSQYEKWDKRLKERIQENIKLYKDKDLEDRIKNAQLKEELMKMTDSYDKLKEKFQHFEKYDDLRFKDIYDMKSKEAKDLALKVALADRTIKTQQLGMEILNNDNPEGFSLEELQKEQDIEEDNDDDKAKVNQEELNFRQNILSRIPMERVNQVFTYIIQEAEFLIEMEIIEQAHNENWSFEQKLPRYIESICKALNIKNEQELNQLLDLFEKNNMAEKEELKISHDNSQHSDESVDVVKVKTEKGKSLIIDPDRVLELLKEFYTEKKNKAKEQSNLYKYLIFSDWKYYC